MLTSVIAAGMVQALRLGQIRLARRKACSPLRTRVTRIINHRYSLAALRRRASRSKGLSRNPRFPRPELIFSGEPREMGVRTQVAGVSVERFFGTIVNRCGRPSVKSA